MTRRVWDDKHWALFSPALFRPLIGSDASTSPCGGMTDGTDSAPLRQAASHFATQITMSALGIAMDLRSGPAPLLQAVQVSAMQPKARGRSLE